MPDDVASVPVATLESTSPVLVGGTSVTPKATPRKRYSMRHAGPTRRSSGSNTSDDAFHTVDRRESNGRRPISNISPHHCGGATYGDTRSSSDEDIPNTHSGKRGAAAGDGLPDGLSATHGGYYWTRGATAPGGASGTPPKRAANVTTDWSVSPGGRLRFHSRENAGRTLGGLNALPLVRGVRHTWHPTDKAARGGTRGLTLLIFILGHVRTAIRTGNPHQLRVAQI